MLTSQGILDNYNDYEDFLNYCTQKEIAIHSDESIEKFFLHRKENLTRKCKKATYFRYRGRRKILWAFYYKYAYSR